MENITRTPLSIYRNSFDTHGEIRPLAAVIERIRDGKRGLDEKTKMCNSLAQTDPKAYKQYKESKLPAVTFAGTFPRGKRKAEHCKQHSKFVVLDVDSLTAEQIPDILAALAQDPRVVLAFVSPSGKGIKVIVRVDPTPQNDAEHKTAWHTCVEAFSHLAEEHGFEIDPSGKDCSRLCYLAHDPLAIFNSEVAVLIEWDPSDVYLHTSDLEDYQHTATDTTSLKAFLLSQNIKILGPRPRGGFFVECLNRAEHTGGLQGRSDSFVRLMEGGAGVIFHCSHAHCEDKKSGWFFQQLGLTRDPFRKTKQRYTVDTDFQHDTSSINAERTGNLNAISQWISDTEDSEAPELLLMGSAAGTGKTTVAITTAEQLLYIAKTTEEADQVYQVLFDAGDDVIRHRPRLYNRDHENWDTLPLGLGEHERSCIQPEACNLLAERGHDTFEVCRRCPSYADCVLNAYLGQAEREHNTAKVVYSWDEVMACDSIHKARVQQICTADDILIVDEVNPANLTQHRKITRDDIYDVTERFRDINTKDEYETLKPLLELISTAETSDDFIHGLKTHLASISDISQLDKKLEKFPVGYVFEKVEGENYKFKATLHYRGKEVTVPVIPHETHEDTPVFEMEPHTPITTGIWQLSLMPLSFLLKVGLAKLDDPPRRYNHLLSDVQEFIAQHPNLETAPFAFDPKAQTFDFHLKPTLNHNRVIFNTASDPDNLISEAYRDTDVNITRHTGTTPAWKTDLVFQISTGNYLPRHSLIAADAVTGDLMLKPRAQEMVNSLIQPSIDAGLKTLIVAPKAFQKIASLKALTDHDTVSLINHHHAEGRNDYQDFDIVFVFHYEPEHHDIQQIAKRLYRNAEIPLSFKREKRTVTVRGVSFKKNVYIDERVQAVYNRECRQRLMQSAMRLRPNIHEGKMIVFLTAEPADIPVTPVPFSLSDADGFNGNWETFSEYCQQKATAATQGDVEGLTDAGVSERTAQRRTQQARQQRKAERDAEIARRYAAEESKKQIATAMKISQDTVKRILDKHVF